MHAPQAEAYECVDPADGSVVVSRGGLSGETRISDGDGCPAPHLPKLTRIMPNTAVIRQLNWNAHRLPMMSTPRPNVKLK
jgi:hypothetical protein